MLGGATIPPMPGERGSGGCMETRDTNDGSHLLKYFTIFALSYNGEDSLAPEIEALPELTDSRQRKAEQTVLIHVEKVCSDKQPANQTEIKMLCKHEKSSNIW